MHLSLARRDSARASASSSRLWACDALFKTYGTGTGTGGEKVEFLIWTSHFSRAVRI